VAVNTGGGSGCTIFCTSGFCPRLVGGCPFGATGLGLGGSVGSGVINRTTMGAGGADVIGLERNDSMKIAALTCSAIVAVTAMRRQEAEFNDMDQPVSDAR